MKKTGCLSGFLGTVVMIIVTIILGVLTSLLANAVFGARFDGEVVCAVLKLSVYSFVVYFVLCEVIFFTWQACQIRKEEGKSDKQQSGRFERISRIIYAASLAAMLIFALINVNTYTEYREDSISEKFFVTTKKYEWDNVMRYSLSCKSDGELTFTVTMKDGKNFELFRTVTSCSDEFLEKYENMFGYAAYLANEFDAQDNFIEKRISGKDHMREIYKEDYPEVWNYILEIGGDEFDENDQSDTQGSENSTGNEEITEASTQAE